MLPFELNLAPLRYGPRLLSEHGPLESLRHFRKDRLFEAYATLRPSLTGVSQLAKATLYGNCHGTGTHPKLRIAEAIAITEALERWAFAQTIAESPNKFGFEIDPSTSGMAAFPSFTVAPARRRALSEAHERWCLTQLHLGALGGAIQSGEDSFQLTTQPIGSPLVFMLLGKHSSAGWAYGFASARNAAAAAQHAEHELLRNVDALQKLHQNTPSLENLPLEEQRLVRFSTAEGHQALVEHLMRSKDRQTALPLLIVDEELRGPWNQYVRVWRSLYENGTPPRSGLDVFFF